MVQLTSGCCQIWLSLKAKTPQKTQNFGLSLKTKNFPFPKRATLDKRIFLDFKGSPLLCQPNPENMAKSAVALHVSNNLCLKSIQKHSTLISLESSTN